MEVIEDPYFCARFSLTAPVQSHVTSGPEKPSEVNARATDEFTTKVRRQPPHDPIPLSPPKMAPKKKTERVQENVSLGPQVREGELVFGVARIFASTCLTPLWTVLTCSQASTTRKSLIVKCFQSNRSHHEQIRPCVRPLPTARRSLIEAAPTCQDGKPSPA
jgi:hypothetical protein